MYVFKLILNISMQVLEAVRYCTSHLLASVCAFLLIRLICNAACLGIIDNDTVEESNLQRQVHNTESRSIRVNSS